MGKPLALGLTIAAVLLAVVVGFLSFGRRAAPVSTAIPASPNAIATQDGAELSNP